MRAAFCAQPTLRQYAVLRGLLPFSALRMNAANALLWGGRLPQHRSLAPALSTQSSSSSAPAAAPPATSEASDVAPPATSAAPAVQPTVASAAGAVAIPGIPQRGLAGVSAASIAEWQQRAAQGATLPMNWSNPGAFAQLGKVPDHVLYALPPPRRPLWPMAPSVLTWRYLRVLSIALLFLLLAGYLQAKTRVRGAVRLELERSYPWLVALLARLGVIHDMASVIEKLDRPHLLTRIFARFSRGGAAALAPTDAPETIPTARAVALLATLRGEGAPLFTSASGSDVAAAAAASPSNSPSAIDAIAVSPATAAALALACGVAAPPPPRLTREQCAAFLAAGCADLSNAVVALGCAELLGVRPLSPAAWEALSGLYDRVVVAAAARRGGTAAAAAATTGDGLAISAKELASMSGDIGFSPELAPSERAIDDAAASSLRPPLLAGIAAVAIATKLTPLTRAEFIDFMAAAAAAAQVDDARIADYLNVYYVLHMSGIKEAAGVR